MRLRLCKNIELKDLEKFGFQNGVFTRTDKNENVIYQVVITRNNKNVQVYTNNGVICGSLQCLIYDLTKDGYVYKVEE